MKKIVAFDFDGVLCDSTVECMITGYNAWMKLTGKEDFINTEKEVPADLAVYFRQHRGLVRTGGQYFVIFYSYENGRITSEAEFDLACGRFEEEIIQYEELFFLCRDLLRDNDVKYWLDLHTSYKGVPENIKKITERTSVYIVTGKDRESVQTFLRAHNIDIQGHRIYDKDAAHNKLEALAKIAEREKVLLSDVLFVDDNINHIIKPRDAGCAVYLAEWGYHSPEQLQKAREEQVPILSLDDWYGRIMKVLDAGG